MAALIVLGLIVLLGVLAVLGWTADSRDPEYSLGRILSHRPTRHDGGPDGAARLPS